MTPYPVPDTAVIKSGYENFTPPTAPPGMYYDRESELVLPLGTRPVGIGRVIASWILAILLFGVTLGVGYLIWAAIVWGHGQTPAQQVLGLRCWRPEASQVAGRMQMAIRQVTGLLLNGELVMGFLIMLISKDMNSVGDFFAGTVVLRDPDNVLLSWTAPHR
jgi:uncharacterized RDD family membrane protein YckC